MYLNWGFLSIYFNPLFIQMGSWTQSRLAQLAVEAEKIDSSLKKLEISK